MRGIWGAVRDKNKGMCKWCKDYDLLRTSRSNNEIWHYHAAESRKENQLTLSEWVFFGTLGIVLLVMAIGLGVLVLDWPPC